MRRLGRRKMTRKKCKWVAFICTFSYHLFMGIDELQSRQVSSINLVWALDDFIFAINIGPMTDHCMYDVNISPAFLRHLHVLSLKLSSPLVVKITSEDVTRAKSTVFGVGRWYRGDVVISMVMNNYKPTTLNSFARSERD
jgi:hypothetical protein